MLDVTQANSDSESIVTEEVSQKSVRVRFGRHQNLLAGCIGVAAVIVLVMTFLKPPDGSDAASNNAASEKVIAPQPPTVAVSRPPAVSLVSLAVPATAEQLQQEAERVANELRSRFPNLAEALHVTAMMHSQFGRTAEAERLWRKCIELSPKYEGYYVNLAAVAMDRGNSESAVETLQQAIDAGCSSPDVFHHLAVALTNLGKCEEAITAIQKALATEPQFTSGWLVLGQAQLKLDQAAGAEASLRKAMSLGAQSAEIYFALGTACVRQNKLEEAAAFRKQFTELQATQPLAAQQRFQILSAADARRTTVAILSEAATVHSWQGDSLEAERLFLRAIALDPSGVASCRALATLYHAAEMHPEERVVRRRLVEIEPHNFDNYVNLAKVSAQLGEPEAAEATLKLAIAMRPEAAIVYATLAQFYLQTGKAKQARWYAQEAVRREPSAEGYRFLASTCRSLGDTADAEAALNMARKLEPSNPRLEQTTPLRPLRE